MDILLHNYFNGAAYILTRWGVQQECRWIRISDISDDYFIGSNVEILSGMQTLFGIKTQISRESDEDIILTEYTSTDELMIFDKKISDTEFTELYLANGQYQFSYSRYPQIEETRVPTEQELLQSQSLATQLPSLYDNYEGERLVQLTTDVAFQNWYLAEFGSSHNPDRISLTRGLGIASLKCLAGGFANPVCAAVVIVDAGLLMCEFLVCDVIPFFGGSSDGCDNLPGWW